MPPYDDMLTLAEMCAKNARTAGTKAVARELWKMANEYRTKAMALDSGHPIDIGLPPEF
jgi:hypothetical protein